MSGRLLRWHRRSGNERVAGKVVVEGWDLMQAIEYDHFGPPEVLRVVDTPAPEPGPGEVRVDLRAASVIPGDCKLRAGRLQAHFAVTFPKIPGRDGAGVVSQLGAGVRDIALGSKVCVVAQHTEQGTYAQAIVRNAGSMVPMPPNLSFEEGAALMHAGVCAWICLVETARVTAGMRVLVHAGAGAIGGMAVQLARHLDAHVTATCRFENAEYVRSLGADEVIAYDREDFARRCRDMDVVLDLMGGAVHARSYSTLRRWGQMVCLINEPFEDRSADFGVSVTTARIHDSPQVLRAVTDLASSGILRPQIRDCLPLVQAVEAHRRIERHTVTRGRLVLQMS